VCAAAADAGVSKRQKDRVALSAGRGPTSRYLRANRRNTFALGSRGTCCQRAAGTPLMYAAKRWQANF
jgi:hypothetical protein